MNISPIGFQSCSYAVNRSDNRKYNINNKNVAFGMEGEHVARGNLRKCVNKVFNLFKKFLIISIDEITAIRALKQFERDYKQGNIEDFAYFFLNPSAFKFNPNTSQQLHFDQNSSIFREFYSNFFAPDVPVVVTATKEKGVFSFYQVKDGERIPGVGVKGEGKGFK